MKKKLNLKNPVTFNEKLQWLKIYDPTLRDGKLVDKYLVREFIAKELGSNYLIPLIGVWKKPSEINLLSLPEKFVLKTNHDSGGIVICEDKSNLNFCKTTLFFKKRLKTNLYWKYRETPYKNINRLIIAEEFLGADLVDYKFFCFNGNPYCVMVCIGRQLKRLKFYFFNNNWELLRINKYSIEAPEDFTLKKPENYDELISIAKKLSKDFKFVRVDLYNLNGKIYFGELTFFPAAGFDSNLPYETDLLFGNLLKLD